MSRVFKHLPDQTEVIVIDAQTASIVRVSSNLAESVKLGKVPSRQEAIAKALQAISSRAEAAPKAVAPEPKPAAAALPTPSESVNVQRMDKAFADFEKELDGGIGAGLGKG